MSSRPFFHPPSSSPLPCAAEIALFPKRDPLQKNSHRDLALLAEFLAREMDFDERWAADRTAAWYREQVGADQSTDLDARLLRSYTREFCRYVASGRQAKDALAAEEPSAVRLRREKVSEHLDFLAFVLVIVFLFSFGALLLAPPDESPAAAPVRSAAGNRAAS